MKLNKLFLEHCKINKFEINKNQLEIIDNLEKFYNENYSSKFFSKLFNNTKKISFYLVGDVGVGKTMLLNFENKCNFTVECSLPPWVHVQKCKSSELNQP